jgi:hypothetical protein
MQTTLGHLAVDAAAAVVLADRTLTRLRILDERELTTATRMLRSGRDRRRR